jgi:ABC-type branched-subunit amino acid transport system ATPase component/ABC-type branched-subunit amino acid transport system permease subunit
MAGLLDLGYAAFYAIGAYTTAILTADAGFSWWAALVPAMVAAAVAGAVLGYPTLRLRGDYLAIVTLGFGEIVRITAVNLDSLTGGPNGKVVGARPVLLGRELTSVADFYWLALAMALVTLVATRNLARSRLGRAWQSVREDEAVAEAVGVASVRAKLYAYVLGSVWAGLAGALSAAKFGIVNPTSFTFTVSVLILVVVVLGGRGSFPGVVLGAVVVAGLPEALRGIEEWKYVGFGLALIVVMLVRRQGLLPAPRTRDDPFAVLPGTGGEDLPGAGDLRAAEDEARPGGLVVDGLRHRFGGLVAVDGVSFSVDPGEIVGLIGPNGAGKTTVFNGITGVVRPESGRVALGDRVLTGLAPHAVVAAGVARTFQGTRLFDGLTAADNVLAGMDGRLRAGVAAALLHLPRQRREEGAALGQARAWLDFVGLSGRGGRCAADLSLADQRRLDIARALASGPSVLLLDEPAAGLNPVEKASLAALVRRIRDAGTTVVLIEHDIAFVEGLCDRVLVMDAGRLLAEGTPAQVRAHPLVIEAYLGADDEPARAAAGGEARDRATGEPLLDVQGLRAGYGSVTVLTDVSFRVGEGEVVALLGANGAGKTTALRTISGLERARSGSVTFDGSDITNASAHRVVGRGLVQVPEGARVFAGLSVEENLRLGGFLDRRNRALVAARREGVYSVFPVLRERRAQLAGTLSGGERQMLAIGRALMAEPKLLCLDEPSMGLAPLLVRRTFARIAEVAARGTAVLIVEQNVAGALRLADRAYVLETGGVVLEGASADLGADPRVRAAYLGSQG